MDYQEEYNRWVRQLSEDAEATTELAGIENDPVEIKDRFYRNLEFGTGGLRGILGIGTDRMNLYTVRKATQGLANYLVKTAGEQPSVAISYDSRICSELFAQETAAVLAANGIQAWIYSRLEPTPALSFAVRDLGCSAGVCITASHNPAQYNGYKVYGPDGCQITVEAAHDIQAQIEKVNVFSDVHTLSYESGLHSGMIRNIPEETLTRFLNAVLKLRPEPDVRGNCDLRIVYTPLNGAGRECVARLMPMLGIHDFTVVPEQELPDGTFPTCPYPNPEIPEALALGLKLCEEKQADLLIGTDPDCDRLGIAVPGGGEYRLLSGNEVGVLLANYLCEIKTNHGTMPKDPVIITTTVSTSMVDAVAEKYGVEVQRVLTGFKFIGERIGELEKVGQSDRFLFGFEESYGYLSGTHVRDKDAVNAAMLVCEMVRHYRNQGRCLWEVLQSLYQEFGYYRNQLLSFSYEGAEGNARMRLLMAGLREHVPEKIAGQRVTAFSDYAVGLNNLPKADVLEYQLENNCKVIIRPSGTEPKIKVYLSAKGHDAAQADAKSQALSAALKQML